MNFWSPEHLGWSGTQQGAGICPQGREVTQDGTTFLSSSSITARRVHSSHPCPGIVLEQPRVPRAGPR